MPPKSGKPEVELKVNIPRALMDKLNEYRHEKRFETRKDAVIAILSVALKDVIEPPATLEAISDAKKSA